MISDNETYRRTLLCFDNAISKLAIGVGGLKLRLIDASLEFLYQVKREDLPTDDLKDCYDSIIKQLTKKDALRDSEGKVIYDRVRMSLYKRRNSTLQQIVRDILYLRDRMNSIIILELKGQIDSCKINKN